MPRPRFSRLAPARQSALIDAAAREFSAHGFTGASMNRIIGRANFSKGALYYYFDDKEDLYLAVILDAHRRVRDRLGDFPAVSGVEEFWSTVGELFRKVARYTLEYPLAMGLQRSLAAAVKRGDLKRPLSDFQQAHLDFHRQLVSAGQRVGAVRTDLPDDLVFPLLEAVNEAADTWLAGHYDSLDLLAWERVMTRFQLLYRRILEPGPEAGERML